MPEDNQKYIEAVAQNVADRVGSHVQVIVNGLDINVSADPTPGPEVPEPLGEGEPGGGDVYEPGEPA